MGNSNIKLESIADDARNFGEISPTMAIGGSADQPALSIATDVMNFIIAGGPQGQRFNWKFNSFNLPSFATISLQQDYAIPGLVQLGWLEGDCYMVNANTTSFPKRKCSLEIKRDIAPSSMQIGYPGKACWLPNNRLQYGSWGVTAQASDYGLTNPGPGVVYTNPVGTAGLAPVNPTTQIKDPNGNFWVLTTYGTCGSVQPTWPNPVTYPTTASPTATATTVADGSVVWTAVNPNGQGIRIWPVPASGGTVWQIYLTGQYKPVPFTSLGQMLDPLPDDFVTFFKQGFFAECYRRAPDPKVRQKFAQEHALWLQSLDIALRSYQREEDDECIYPGSSVMDNSNNYVNLGPAWPFNGAPGGY